MRASGQVEVLRESASVALWDGHRMAGPWLVQEAIRWGLHAAKRHGAAHVVVRRSHHIAALAAYLEHRLARVFLSIYVVRIQTRQALRHLVVHGQ